MALIASVIVGVGAYVVNSASANASLVLRNVLVYGVGSLFVLLLLAAILIFIKNRITQLPTPIRLIAASFFYGTVIAIGLAIWYYFLFVPGGPDDSESMQKVVYSWIVFNAFIAASLYGLISEGVVIILDRFHSRANSVV